MRKLLTLAAIALLLVSLAMWVPKEFALQAQSAPAARKLAFLVGVKEYEHSGLKSLDFPERDVDEFAKTLRRSGFTVVLLTTAEGQTTSAMMPTAANIQTQLEKLIAKVSRRDMILVGLAGHGIQPLGSDSAYFCPQDANPSIAVGVANQPSTVKFPTTLLGIDDLLLKLDESGIGRKLVLMDACRNDPGVRGRRGIDRVKVSALPQETGVLLSCSPGQFAFEHKSFGGGHGAFFHHVIEGLNGKANDLEEGGVTWESLVKYVSKRVPATVKQQYGSDGGEQRPNLIANLSVDGLLLARNSSARVTDTPVSPPARPTTSLSPKPSEETLVAGAKAGEEWAANCLEMKFCWCPSGTFLMGSPKDELDRQDDETQVYVKLTKGFWLAKHEVTQGEWRLLMRSTVAEQRDLVDKTYPLPREGDEFPMYYVNSLEASQFCEKLTKQERAAGRLPMGWTYNLPTEAQWEYGCRAGTTTATAFGSRLDSTQANFNGNYPYNGAAKGVHKDAPVVVGGYAPNNWMLYDMHGNVCEWCSDYYSEKLPGGSDPAMLLKSSDRVYRGGNWSNFGGLCRAAFRVNASSELRSDNLGFRVAAVQLSQ